MIISGDKREAEMQSHNTTQKIVLCSDGTGRGDAVEIRL